MILRDRYAELSLDGWDAANGGIVGPATRDGDRERGGRGAAGKGGEGGETATAAIVAKIELVEDELPGGDAVDVTVSSSNDRKVRVVFVFCFLWRADHPRVKPLLPFLVRVLPLFVVVS